MEAEAELTMAAALTQEAPGAAAAAMGTLIIMDQVLLGKVIVAVLAIMAVVLGLAAAAVALAQLVVALLVIHKRAQVVPGY